MSPLGLRLRNRCGWKTDFSVSGWDLQRGRTGAHPVPSDARLSTNLTRTQQEAWDREMHDLSHGREHRPKV